jgi:FKBP-type peptidyl-prolyl cis-trans isomerase
VLFIDYPFTQKPVILCLMKKNIIFLTILIVTLVLWGCKGKSGSGPKKENFDKDASYALGMNIGSNLAIDGITPNSEQFLKGMKDVISGGKTRFTEDESIQIIQAAYSAMMEKRSSEAMQKGIDFLVENGKKAGVITTSSGLQYEVIKEGTGAKPAASDMVKVHYEGKLIDGATFDNSGDTPIEFPLNQVISGWTEGLQLMSVGSKYKFYIPSELGYGADGAGPIPPNSVLIFEVELLDILK